MIPSPHVIAAQWRLLHVPMNRIYVPPNRFQMDVDHIVALSAQLVANPRHEPHPVIVQPDGAWYELVDGRHRYVAMLVAGRHHIPAVTEATSYDDDAG